MVRWRAAGREAGRVVGRVAGWVGDSGVNNICRLSHEIQSPFSLY